MRVEITEAVWLDERHEFSLSELAQLSGLTEAELVQLVECEALTPARSAPEQAVFGAHCLVIARAARRLRNDFELDAEGMALVLSLLERIRGLESEVRSLHAKFPGRAR